jgi:ribonuclease T2
MMRLGLGLAALLVPGAALAQAAQCDIPARLPRVHLEGPTASEPARRLAIGGYTLSLIWSPQYCRTRLRSAEDAIQCGGGNGPRFGFTLHGLWPDGIGKDWPQYCKSAGLVPEKVVRSTLCSTPSPQLIQHEFAKHATCMPGYTPASYFARSTGLYAKLAFPDMDSLSRRPQTAASVARAFARVNPTLRPDMIRLLLNRQGWLEELWICHDTRFTPTACRPGGPRGTTRVKIWRGRK